MTNKDIDTVKQLLEAAKKQKIENVLINAQGVVHLQTPLMIATALQNVEIQKISLSQFNLF